MTQAYDPKFPQTASGSLYPTNYVVGVIDDLKKAEEAIQAFKNAGYEADEIRLMESQEMVQKVQDLENNKNWFQRFLSGFQAAENDTGADVYRVLAEQGKHILHVRADSKDDVGKISELMQRYGAYTIKFFGTWAVENLPPRDV